MTLKELRKNSKLTQGEVAQKIGVTIRFISALEHGKRNPSDKTKIKLAEIYNVSLKEIFLACKEQKEKSDK